MRLFRSTFKLNNLAAGLGALAVLCGFAIGTVGAQQTDPVDNLQQLLKSRVAPGDPPEVLEHRKRVLMEAAEKLRTINDLRLALMLSEWKDNDPSYPEQAKIDQSVRAFIGERLQKSLHEVVVQGSAETRMAVAKLIGEMGSGIRALPMDDKSGFGRSLAPDLIMLMGQDNPGLRQAAARALGKIDPEPEVAVKALDRMLQSNNVNDRRAASEALAEMVKIDLQAFKKNRAQTGVEISGDEVLDCANQVVRATPVCLNDKDVVVRRNGLEALFQATTALVDQIPGTGPGADLDREAMPPSGRQWTQFERTRVNLGVEALEKKEKTIAPVLAALKDEGGLIAKTLTDPDVQVRVLSRRALEMMGSSRLRLNQARNVVPTEKGAPERVKREDVLKEAIEPGLLVFAQRVRDPNRSVRAATVDFLETMEDAAAPAIPALVSALGDPDLFIRWAAVRTLGKVGKVKTDVTVPAIAQLLNPQEDPDVREAAATTLRGYGADAKAALPKLIGMLNVGEAEAQEAVIKAITAVGGPENKNAIPALKKSLDSRSNNVRRLAAEALGRMGRLATPALPDLTARLRVEEDNGVRTAISEAIVEITKPRE
jgi:HEAT repeat protein